MPNQRKRGKRLVGAYVSEGQLEALKAEAKLRGINVSDLIKLAVDALKVRKK